MSPQRILRRANGWRLVTTAVLTGVLLAFAFLYRAHQTTVFDEGLCRKIDRFTVIIEGRVRTSPVLSEAQKQETIQVYENFRNDPPVCRTTRP